MDYFIFGTSNRGEGDSNEGEHQDALNTVLRVRANEKRKSWRKSEIGTTPEAAFVSYWLAFLARSVPSLAHGIVNSALSSHHTQHHPSQPPTNMADILTQIQDEVDVVCF